MQNGRKNWKKSSVQSQGTLAIFSNMAPALLRALGLYTVCKILEENAGVCSSVTACSIRHGIVSFSLRVTPIFLKMSPPNCLLRQRLQNLSCMHEMHHSPDVGGLWETGKTPTQAMWSTTFKGQRNNEKRFKKNHSLGIWANLACGKWVLIDRFCKFRALEHGNGNCNLY